MPIYMDRHDVSSEVTAQNVAQLHQEDLKIQDQFCCNALTYWFDDKRKMAFCLIEAPNEQTVADMHRAAHGEVPNNIIEVDPGIVESFLGRIEGPEQSINTEPAVIDDSAFRTIMVVTITQLLVRQNSGVSINYHSEILAQLKVYGGSLVKQTDQYYLASFKSVSNAVLAALAIQASSDNPLTIGLSTGVPVTDKPLLFEDAVKLAERMSRVIKSGVVITSEVNKLYISETGSKPDQDTLVCLTKADEEFLTRLLDYTEVSWRDADLKVADFSKPLGLSKSQLYRKLTSLTGQSPNSFLNEYRLREALLLLNRNTGNVSEVAFETGFGSPSYFSKCFQKRYGHLPSDCLRTG